MPPIGRDLENPSLTSGGQTVTLVNNLTRYFLNNFSRAFECRFSSSLALLVMKIACESVYFWQILSFSSAILRTQNFNKKIIKIIFMTLIPKGKKIYYPIFPEKHFVKYPPRMT